MNLKETTFFKDLNVSDDVKKEKAALVKTQRAYTEYITKKVYAEAEVAIANAEVAKVKAIEEINKTDIPKAGEFNSPEGYSAAIENQVVTEEASKGVIDSVEKILVGANLKLKGLVEWGISKGFDVEA